MIFSLSYCGCFLRSASLEKTVEQVSCRYVKEGQSQTLDGALVEGNALAQCLSKRGTVMSIVLSSRSPFFLCACGALVSCWIAGSSSCSHAVQLRLFRARAPRGWIRTYVFLLQRRRSGSAYCACTGRSLLIVSTTRECKEIHPPPLVCVLSEVSPHFSSVLPLPSSSPSFLSSRVSVLCGPVVSCSFQEHFHEKGQLLLHPNKHAVLRQPP